MPDGATVDLFHLLLFTMPGFFFVWTFTRLAGRTIKSDFECFMFSMFWGIILLVIFFNVLPTERFSPMLSNPYAGAIGFSILAVVLGFCIQLLLSLRHHLPR